VSHLEAPDPVPHEYRPRLETASFEDFYIQQWPWLVRCLIAQAGDSRWAEDIAQDTMLDAREKWDQLLTYDRPDRWLLKVAIRRLRRMERKGRLGCLFSEDDGSVAADLAALAVSDAWIDRNLDLLAAIRTLPRRQAEVVVVHCIADFTLAETGQILGFSEAAAKTHMQRARRRLQELLETGQEDEENLLSEGQQE
jgi:RNA polymerase sigma-70 factor (ECF subfamily)